MLINGRNSVRETLRSGTKISKVFVQANLQGRENAELVTALIQQGVAVITLPKREMDKKVQGRHQGFIAEVEDFVYTDIDVVLQNARAQGKQLFLCILDGIEDPHNLGSIIRSCECAGVDAVVISERGACQVNATVVKVSAGAINHLPIVKVGNINNTIKRLKKDGVWVYGVELGGKSMYDIDFCRDMAIVIGSEGKGISRLTKELCDDILTIPMFGKVNSLNASNATAISLYEVIRQRMR